MSVSRKLLGNCSFRSLVRPETIKELNFTRVPLAFLELHSARLALSERIPHATLILRNTISKAPRVGEEVALPSSASVHCRIRSGKNGNREPRQTAPAREESCSKTTTPAGR